MHRAMSRKI
jgi:hypothetical protein